MRGGCRGQLVETTGKLYINNGWWLRLTTSYYRAPYRDKLWNLQVQAKRKQQ